MRTIPSRSLTFPTSQTHRPRANLEQGIGRNDFRYLPRLIAVEESSIEGVADAAKTCQRFRTRGDIGKHPTFSASSGDAAQATLAKEASGLAERRTAWSSPLRSNPEPERRHYGVPEGTLRAVLEWRRFRSMEEACSYAADDSCVYALQSESRESLYVGKTSSLKRRYSPAAGLVGALMSEAKVLLFVARVKPELLDLVEHTIIFWDAPPRNRRGLGMRPSPHLPLVHSFEGVSCWWGSGCDGYEGPRFCEPGALRDRYTGQFR